MRTIPLKRGRKEKDTGLTLWSEEEKRNRISQLQPHTHTLTQLYTRQREVVCIGTRQAWLTTGLRVVPHADI